MNHLTIKIHWKGPYFLEEIEELEARNGLYLFAGKQKYQREDDIQYFGITKGEITYPSDFAREHLETAESIMVYFWGASLNERKKYTPPRPTTVISHWFKKDGTPRFNQKSLYKNLPDVISWDGEYWRQGNLIVYQE